MTLVADGETVHKNLAELGSRPITIMDAAATPLKPVLTADAEAALAWSGMVADVGAAWQSPAIAPVKARRGSAQDRSLWVDGSQVKTVEPPPAASPQAQATDAAEVAHATMVSDMMDAWKNPQ